MKASELKKGQAYGSVWGFELVFIGTEKLSAYYEELDETLGDVRYVFRGADGVGTSCMSASEVERFIG